MARFALAVVLTAALSAGVQAQSFNGNNPDPNQQAPDPNQSGGNFNQEKQALLAHGAARFKAIKAEEEKKYQDAVKACGQLSGAERTSCRQDAAKQKKQFQRQLQKAKASFKKFANSKTLVLNGKTTEEVWNGFNEKQINDSEGKWEPYADRGPIGTDNGQDPVAQWWQETESFNKQRKDAVLEGKEQFKALRTEQSSIFGKRLQDCGSLAAGERAACRKTVQDDKKEFNSDFAKAKKDYLSWVKGKEVVLRGKTEAQVFAEWSADYKERTGWSPEAMPAAVAAGGGAGGMITPLAAITEVDGGHAVNTNGQGESGGSEKPRRTPGVVDDDGGQAGDRKCSDEERRSGFRQCRREDRREHRRGNRDEAKEHREEQRAARAECAKLTDLTARSNCFQNTYKEGKEFRQEERAENREWRGERRDDRKAFEEKMKANRNGAGGGTAGNTNGQ